MIWLLANWRLLAIAGGVLGILAIGGVVWHKIDQAGYNRCEAAYSKALNEANSKVIEKKKVIKHETSSLDRDGIVKQLCAANWMRDAKDCPK